MTLAADYSRFGALWARRLTTLLALTLLSCGQGREASRSRTANETRDAAATPPAPATRDDDGDPALANHEEDDDPGLANGDGDEDRGVGLEHLRALGYVTWDPGADVELSGVVLYDEDRASPGYNIYTNDGERVYLTDLQGNRVHEWALPSGKRWCEYAELMDNGDVAVVCVGRSLTVLNRDSEVLIDLSMLVHHDVHVMPDRTMLVPFQEKRPYNGRQVWFDGIATVSGAGRVVADWHVYPDLDNLRRLHAPSPLDTAPEPDRSRGKSDYFDYYHLNTIEVLPDTPLGRRDPRFRPGYWLICLRNVNLIVVLDHEKSPTWSWGEGVLELPHMPTMLPNGNILVFDNGTDRGFSRVLEIAPDTGEIVWQYQGTPPESFLSEWRGSSQRLQNGNTLICESERGHVFEITPDGEKVWEFWNTEMKKGKRKRIYRFLRVPRSRVARITNQASTE